MNLTQVATLTKKYIWLPFVLLTPIIILLYILVIKPAVENNANLAKLPLLEKPLLESLPTKLTQVSSQLTLPKLPLKLSVYQVAPALNFVQNSDAITKQFKIQGKFIQTNDVSFGQGKIYSNPGGTLLIYQEVITYQKSITKSPLQGTNIDNLKTQAQNFLTNLGLDTSNLELIKTSLLGFVGEDISETENIQNASLVEFTFAKTVNGYKIISPSAQTSVSVDYNGLITGLTYRAVSPGPAVNDYPIINADQAIKSLPQKGVVVKASPDYSLPQFIPFFVIKNAYLAYYLPAKTPKIIQPVWVFEGETLVNNSTINLTAAIPAIEEKYIQNP